MARRLARDATGRFLPSGDRAKRSNPASNPSILGEDLETTAAIVLGMGFSGMVSDKLVGPFIKQAVPWNQEGLGKIIDAVSTFAAAYISGEAIGMASNKWGRLVQKGGTYLGVAKLLSVPISGFSLSATFPMIPYFPSYPSQVAPSAAIAALPAATVVDTQMSSLGVGSTGL